MTIRRATPDDVPTVVDLWNEAKAWLASKGLDQWQYPIKMHNVRSAIQRGSCWLVEPAHGPAVATITLDREADPELWRADEHPDDAPCVHRLVVRRSEAGNGLGDDLLDWASDQVRHAGRKLLRLDAWTNNPGLHDHYRRRAFRLVRVVDDPSGSGALFERDA